MGSVQGEHDSIVGQIGGRVVGGQGEQVTVGGHVVEEVVVGQGEHVTVGHVKGEGHVVEGEVVGHVPSGGWVGVSIEAALRKCIMYAS